MSSRKGHFTAGVEVVLGTAFALLFTSSLGHAQTEPGVQPTAAPVETPAPTSTAEPVAQPPLGAAAVAPPPTAAAPASAPPAPAPAPVPAPAPASAVPSAPVAPEPAAPPKAEKLTLEPIASFWDRYELHARDNTLGVPGVTDMDQMRYRARFGLMTSPAALGGGRSITLRFVPQASGTWNVGGDTLDDAALGLHEGVLALSDEGYRFELGRFEMSYGDALVIGNVDLHPTGRSFDGARLHIAPGDGALWIDTFFTVLDEGNARIMPAGPLTEPFAVGDRYFTGVYVGLGKLLAASLDLDMYMFGLIAPVSRDAMNTTDVDASTRMTWGARAKQRDELVDYRAEVGLQAGQDSDAVSALAYQLDAELGVNLADDRVRVGLEGLLASGDDSTTADKNEGWNQLFPTTRKWLGFADLIDFNAAGKNLGRNNLASGVLHLSFSPHEKWSLLLDGHAFLRPEHAPSAGSYAASEVDLTAAYTIGKGLKLRGGYFIFVPTSDYYATSSPTHHAELELRYDL